jgi:hypothetical protein
LNAANEKSISPYFGKEFGNIVEKHYALSIRKDVFGCNRTLIQTGLSSGE